MRYSQHLVSGGLSGFTSAICLQPFDLLKTRLQQGDRLAAHQGVRGVAAIMRNLIATDGVLGLWRGTLPTLARNVPGVALYMSTLHQVRTAMAKSKYFSKSPSSVSSSPSVLPALSGHGNLMAGAATRAAVGTVLNPFSVLKARYESDFFAYKNLGSAFWSLVRSGPSQVFRGAMTSAIRDAPHAGLFLVSYEYLKRESAVLLHPVSPSSAMLINASAGAGAGTFATILTQPFDVLKTRLQVRSEDTYRTLRSTAQAVWMERGAVGFFDGVLLRMSRKVLSSAIGWAVYEALLSSMQNDSKHASL